MNLKKGIVGICFILIINFSEVLPANAVSGGTKTPNSIPVVTIQIWFPVGTIVANGTNIGICSGTLINPWVVITAAHCIINAQNVHADSVEVSQPNQENTTAGIAINGSTNWVQSSSFIFPSNYAGGSTIQNFDIAFIELPSPINTGSSILISSQLNWEYFKNQSVPITASGYGYTSDNDQTLPISPMSASGIIDQQNNPLGLVDAANMDSVNSFFCDGDSGGPVTTLYNNQLYLVGIISGGVKNNNCLAQSANGSYQMTFTIVSEFADLIGEASNQAMENQSKYFTQQNQDAIQGLTSQINADSVIIQNETNAANQALAQLQTAQNQINADSVSIQNETNAANQATAQLQIAQNQIQKLQATIASLQNKIKKVCQVKIQPKNC